MTQEHENQQPVDTHECWRPPDAERRRKAVTTARSRRKKTITRTIIFKLHKPGRRKTQALLWAQVQVTRMTAHILEALRETPGEVRYDKALAFVQETYSRKAQGEKSDRTIILATILEFCFHEKRTSDTGETTPQKTQQQKAIKKWIPPLVTPIRATDYPVTAHLRTGVYREVARTLLTWYSRVTRTDTEGHQAAERDNAESAGGEETPQEADGEQTESADSSAAEHSEPDDTDAPAAQEPTQVSDTAALHGVFDIVEVHRLWAARRQPYEAAAQTIVPFGWYRGKTLEQVGKREVRWLRERLIPEQQARETLDHIEVLLEPERYEHDDPERLRRAQQARHPWRRQTGLQRKTRVSRAFQRSLDVKEPLIRLKTLNNEELLNLQPELEEMVEFASQFAAIRTAVAIFLSPAPARYPTVPRLLTDAEWREKWGKYDAYLESLNRDVFEENQDEADETAQQFQSVASEIGRPELQPLAFKRPMRPGVATFALLYAVSTPDESELRRKYRRMKPERLAKKVADVLQEGELYTYVLAVVIHGEEAFSQAVPEQQEDAPEDDPDESSAQTPSPLDDVLHLSNQPPERFAPNVRPGLFYVNYPHTPFVLPRGASVLLFPVECGEHYHEQEFLRSIIDRQLQRQETGFLALHEKQREEQARKAADRQKAVGETPQQDDEKKLPESKEAYFPRNAPLGSARIISERTRYGFYDFYIHIPVKDETPRLVRTIRTVLGFHEHAYGYSYAHIDFEGNVLEVGDVAIAPHALPKEGDTSYSDNYVYETVKAMIALARPGIHGDTPANTGAIIGLEHAAWKKQRVTLSREQNRLQFSRPSRKIATVLGYKAPQVGLPRPLDRIVSLKQCSVCSVRRDASLSNIYPKTERCPTCGSTNLEETEPGSGELQCEACTSIWQEYEPWFVCPSCGHRQMARLNTATVVAQSTLTGFVTYYKAVADKQASQQKGSKSNQ